MLYLTAKYRRKAKAEIVREALQTGLKIMRPKSHTAKALLEFAKKSAKITTKGSVPKDFVKNMDYYTWGGTKRE